ncbi:MAG: hypothetical protein WCP68_13755 [Enhydrobacter sp.]
MQSALDPAERVFVDNSRYLHLHPLRLRTGLVRAAVVSVELMAATVGRVGQEIMQAAGAEAAATPCDAALVEVVHDRLQTLGCAFAAEIEIEDGAHLARLDLVDDQYFLVFVAAPLLDDRGIAERWYRAVPEALPCVLQHGAVGVLGVLA